MQIVNMFGETVEIKEPSKKTKTMQERYGVIEGKTCKTCEHCYAAGYNRRFYKCELTQFTIGTVDCGAQNIWITFDPRIADCLLGMDILHRTCFLNNPDEKRLEIYSDMGDIAEELRQRT